MSTKVSTRQRRPAILPRIETIGTAEEGMQVRLERVIAKEDEIEELKERLRATEHRLAAAQALQNLALRVVGAAHDLNNQLTIMGANLSEVSMQTPATADPYIQALQCAMSDSRDLVARMLARSISSTQETCCVSTVVYEVMTLIRPLHAHIPDLRLRSSLKATPAIHVNPFIVRQVLTNVLLNGIAAMPAGGTLTISSYVVGQHVSIAVIDSGTGIAAEIKPALFTPFATTRFDGRGLGLASSRALVEEAFGTLTIESELGKGTTVTATFPAAR